MLFINGVAHSQEHDVPDGYDTYEIPLPNSLQCQQYRKQGFIVDGVEYHAMVCDNVYKAYEYLCEKVRHERFGSPEAKELYADIYSKQRIS